VLPLSPRFSGWGPVAWASGVAAKIGDKAECLVEARSLDRMTPMPNGSKSALLPLVIAEHSNTATAKIGTTGVVKSRTAVYGRLGGTNSVKLAATALYLDCTDPACPDQKKKVAISAGWLLPTLTIMRSPRWIRMGWWMPSSLGYSRRRPSCRTELTCSTLLQAPRSPTSSKSVWDKLNQNLGLQKGVFTSWANLHQTPRKLELPGR